MASFSFVQSVSDQCQKLYVTSFGPALEQARVSALPYLQKFDELVEGIRSDYCAFQDESSRFIESMAGMTAASISRVASTVFPEIVAFVMAISGQTIVPVCILAGRVVSEFSWALSTYCKKEVAIANQLAGIARDEISTRVVQGAVVTSFVAGGAFMVQGVLSKSFPTFMRGSLFLLTAFAARDVIMPRSVC